MKVIALLVLITLALLIPNGVIAKESPYRISAPRLQEKNRKVTIEWYQTQPVLVTVYKLSYTRKLSNNCVGVETLEASCAMVLQKRAIVGNITVVDKGYKKGDQYFIQQNVYQTHNGGYGPFIPK